MRDRTDISDIIILTFQVTCVGQLLKFLRCFFNSVSNQEENLLGAWWSPMACGEKSCSQRPTEKLLTFQNSREPAAYSLLRMLWPHDQYDANNSWRAFSSLDFIFCSLGPLKQSVLQPNTFFQPARSARGPEGLRAESARTVTGRRCPHNGVGEDFLARQPVFF